MCIYGALFPDQSNSPTDARTGTPILQVQDMSPTRLEIVLGAAHRAFIAGASAPGRDQLQHKRRRTRRRTVHTPIMDTWFTKQLKANRTFFRTFAPAAAKEISCAKLELYFVEALQTGPTTPALMASQDREMTERVLHEFITGHIDSIRMVLWRPVMNVLAVTP